MSIPNAIFYLLAIIPFMVGGLLWWKNKNIHWAEWVINSVVCFIMAGIFHWFAIQGQTDDIETQSGQLTQARHYSAWQEYYEEAIHRTEWYTTTESYSYYTGTGKHRHRHTGVRTVRKSRRVFDHWEPRTRFHNDKYSAWSNIDTNYQISAEKFNYLIGVFGHKEVTRGNRRTGEHNSRMIAGDPNDYISINKNEWVEPVTKLVHYENRVKAAPSVFSYAKVPQNIKVFSYPQNNNPFKSNRLIGTTLATVDQFKFDQMNARLGPTKKVNVIMIGMGDRDSIAAKWQEASFIGGKKNDIVITWGGDNKKPDWVVAFGWTDSKITLRQIESIVLENGATTETLPMIEDIIRKSYKLKDFEKAFAHISIPVRPIHLIIYISVMVISQGLLWWFYHANNFDKKKKCAYY